MTAAAKRETPPRRRWAWLAAGAALSLFAVHGEWDLTLAAWLFPAFLLRFSRTSRPAVAAFWMWAVACAGTAFWQYQSEELFSPALLAVGLAWTPFLALPFVLDRLVAPQLSEKGPLLSTLAFPSAKVACELAVALLTPFGTVFGVLGATQHSNLPLIQVASVTGVYGVSFLVAWFGSVAALAWERGFSRPAVRVPVTVCGCVLAAVLALGGVRLAFFPPEGEAVRVAGVSPSREAWDRMRPALGPFDSVGEMVEADPGVLRRAFGGVHDDLLASTVREARAGARLVLWPESAAPVMGRDEGALLSRIGDLAREERVYVDAGLTVYERGSPGVRNETVLVGPDGRVAWTYRKARPVPILEPYEPGRGVLPAEDAPFGRLSGAICYDADFPALMRQAGQDGADIVLVGANNWEGIKKMHAESSVFRAVENGYSVVRQANRGLSVAYDYQGRTLASSDYFATNQQAMAAYVPTEGVRTVYSLVGDLFAWLCVGATVALAGYAAMLAGRRVGRHDNRKVEGTPG